MIQALPPDITTTINNPPAANGCPISPIAKLFQRNSLFLPILAANGLIYFPIILANRPLLDDLGRSIGGYASWAKTGRPFAELLVALTNLGYPVTAAQVSSEVIALAFLALSGWVVATLFEIRSKLLAAICTAPLTAHPYFLENMSYIFDAPSMAAAVLCAVLAVYIAATNLHDAPVSNLPNLPWRSGLAATALTLGTLLFYQPAVNVVFVMGAFTVACDVLKAQLRQAVHLASLLAGSGITALGLYWALLAPGASLEMHYPKSGIGPAYLLLNYWSRVWADWGPNGLFVVFLSIFIPGLPLFFWRADRSNNYALRITIAALIIALAIALQHGLLLFINYEWPFPRTYVSFGTILALIALTTASITEKFYNLKFRLLFNTPSFATYYVLFVIASATGSAMTAQRWFEFGLVMQVTQDVSLLNGGRKPQEVHIVGTAPISPAMTNTIIKFPVVKRIVVNAISNDWIWGHILFQYYAGLWWQQDLGAIDFKRLNSEQPSLVRPWYMMFVLGDRIIVKFRS